MVEARLEEIRELPILDRITAIEELLKELDEQKKLLENHIALTSQKLKQTKAELNPQPLEEVVAEEKEASEPKVTLPTTLIVAEYQKKEQQDHYEETKLYTVLQKSNNDEFFSESDKEILEELQGKLGQTYIDIKRKLEYQQQ